MPLEENRDKCYEVFLIYYEDKTDIHRQTASQIDRKNDRHTGRLTSLIVQNLNIVGLIEMALIKTDKDY